MPTLYIVATPIGNLDDISLRALRTLREVKLIAAEDTRYTRRLLNAYDIKTSATSYHERNKRTKLDYILQRLESEDVALVSDAGMPGISDPGYELVVAANPRGIPVVPIPGPSVIIAALVVSGLPTDRFTYIGFLPHRPGGRRLLLGSVANEPGTIVALESPHRLLDALNEVLLVLGDRRIAVCRELTKIYEEVFRGTINQAIAHFSEPRGEFTLVIEGRKGPTTQLTDAIEKRLRKMRLGGIPAKEAIAQIAAEESLPKKELYRIWIKL
ncbi:MAG: 16S rRNA (cytidine(1402)-2'-O)-methyltransferase [Dehalococcoidales bacterium]|nr:16S rRNA (cytidine(1402)-2'-O)-methyltransferase [Dehalococcoidales bacterium]